MKALNDTDKGCMQKAADVFAERSTAMIVDAEKNLRASMEEKKLIAFTKPDIPAFQAAVAPTVNQLATELGVSPELLAKIKAL
jgi:TRAP-type C4-dicarboxylate transport system substrate-binding protein